MIYRLFIRASAKRDLRQAASWYEKQLAGLGRELIEEVEAALDQVASNPLLYQPVYRDIRRAIVRRFPYGIFYRIEDDAVIVFAIVHFSRDLKSWQDRV